MELQLTAVGGVKLEPGRGRSASPGVEMPARGLEGYVRRTSGRWVGHRRLEFAGGVLGGGINLGAACLCW